MLSLDLSPILIPSERCLNTGNLAHKIRRFEGRPGKNYLCSPNRDAIVQIIDFLRNERLFFRVANNGYPIPGEGYAIEVSNEMIQKIKNHEILTYYSNRDQLIKQIMTKILNSNISSTEWIIRDNDLCYNPKCDEYGPGLTVFAFRNYVINLFKEVNLPDQKIYNEFENSMLVESGKNGIFDFIGGQLVVRVKSLPAFTDYVNNLINNFSEQRKPILLEKRKTLCVLGQAVRQNISGLPEEIWKKIAESLGRDSNISQDVLAQLLYLKS